ncbi:MAG: hypothetical protein R3E87_13425 [Burkholderiaceae bacterium]
MACRSRVRDHNGQANLVLNSLILITTMVGAGLMYYRMWQMWREDKALDTFLRVKKETTDLDNEHVSRAMKKLVATAPFQRRDVKHVLELVADTGGRIRSRVIQAAIEGEVESIHTTMESRWEFPNFLVGFMVALGLLGTFIGLLETLVGTSELIGNFGGDGNMDEAIKSLVTGLQKPLAGMGTAFSASMFGLVGSSVLGMIMMAVRACGTSLINNMNWTVHECAERVSSHGVATTTNVSEGYLANALADLMDVQKDAQETFNETLSASLSITAKSENMIHKLGDVAEAVRDQTESVKRSNDLMAVGPRMRDLSEQTLSEVKAIVQVMHGQAEAVERLHVGLGALERRLAAQNDMAAREREVLRAAVSTIAEGQTATKALLEAVTEQDAEGRATYVREMHALRKSMIDTNAAMSGWGEHLSQVKSLTAEQVLLGERQEGALEQMTNALLGLARQLTVNAESLTRENEAGRVAQIDVAKQLSGLGTVLRLNNEAVIEHMTKLAESNTQSGAVAGMVAHEVRALRGGMGRAVRKELREAVSQIVTARPVMDSEDN